MSDYTFSNDFSAKDALPTGDPDKAIKGSDVDTEFTNIETHMATKANAASPTLTGSATAVNLSVSGTLNATGAFQIGGVAVTSTAAELNKLDGVTATTAEINYLDGVTSNIQTQLDSKQAGGSYASAAQGTLADSAVQPGDNISVLTNNAGYITGYTVTEGDVTAHAAAIDAGSVDGYDIVVTDQSTYDSLTPDFNTLYFING